MTFFKNQKYIKQLIENLQKIFRQGYGNHIEMYPEGQAGELVSAVNQVLAVLNERIQKLEKENNQVQAILSNMAEGVIAVDKETKIISVNPAVENIFNLEGKDVLGKIFLEGIRNNDIFEIMNAVLKNAEFISKELHVLLPIQRIFHVNASPVFSEGVVAGCIIVLHDITEIRRLEKIRSDFIANISHELKTPLTSIKGFVETLIDGGLEDKQNARDFLRIIADHAQRLNSLVNDLLELSHLESREIKLEPEKVNLRELTDMVILGFTSQIKKKGIAVTNAISDDAIITADKEKMLQVLTNLIDNAIKFNKDNGTLDVRSKKEKTAVTVMVEDSGFGIPPKDIPRIFERFYRVDKARSRQLGGTGLGLSIVKHIVELHAGSVGVESTEGLGSRFWFSIPA